MLTTAGEGCRLKTLCKNSVAHVQQCQGCGCISLHIGPLTLRLDETGLESLWAVLGDAAAQVYEARKHNPPTLAPVTRGQA